MPSEFTDERGREAVASPNERKRVRGEADSRWGYQEIRPTLRRSYFIESNEESNGQEQDTKFLSILPFILNIPAGYYTIKLLTKYLKEQL
jgi:hypothetical protein